MWMENRGGQRVSPTSWTHGARQSDHPKTDYHHSTHDTNWHERVSFQPPTLQWLRTPAQLQARQHPQNLFRQSTRCQERRAEPQQPERRGPGKRVQAVRVSQGHHPEKATGRTSSSPPGPARGISGITGQVTMKRPCGCLCCLLLNL